MAGIIETVVFWVVTQYFCGWKLTFQRSMLQPALGLKYLGSGMGVVICKLQGRLPCDPRGGVKELSPRAHLFIIMDDKKVKLFLCSTN